MTYTLLWDNQTNTVNTTMGRYTGGKTYRGENFTGGTDVVGHVVNKVLVDLAWSGSSIAGTVYVVVVKSDFSEIEIGSLDASTLTSTLTEKEFIDDDNTYVMQADDMVCVKYDVVPPSSNYLLTQYSNNSFADSDYAFKVFDNPGYTWTTDESSISASMQIYEKDVTPVSSGVLYPPNIAMVRL